MKNSVISLISVLRLFNFFYLESDKSVHASQDDDEQSSDLLEVLKARSNFESTSSALLASDLMLSTYSL